MPSGIMSRGPGAAPQHSRATVALALLGAAGLLALPARALWRLWRAAALARQSRPYQQHPAAPLARLLVVGDSTAVGTGASAPTKSVAGLIGRAHPRLAIKHQGDDGARMADLPAQMSEAGGRYDMVLVQAGGNDVIRLRGLKALREDIERTLRRAFELAPVVVLMPCGNVGNAPFFFPPLSGWMTRRARALHRACADAARCHGARYVGLFRERDEDPFVHDRALNADDGLHPSDAGYALWWRELQAQAEVSALLAEARTSSRRRPPGAALAEGVHPIPRSPS